MKSNYRNITAKRASWKGNVFALSLRFLAAVIVGSVCLAFGEARVPGQKRNLPPLGEGQSTEEQIIEHLTDAEIAEAKADEAKRSHPSWKSTETSITRAEELRQQAIKYINKAILQYPKLKPKDVAGILRRRAQMLRDRAKRDRDSAKKSKSLRDWLERSADADDRNAQQYENQADEIEKNGHL